MNRIARTLIALALLIACLPAGADHHTANEIPFTPMFDGKTLAGWTQRNGTATYRVENGTIVGKTADGSPNSFLCSDKLYGDFELEFEVKVDPKLNSGVQIRSQTRGGPTGRVNGPQVEIESGDGVNTTSGYVYGEAAGGWMTPDPDRIPHPHFKVNEWNHYRILAVGPIIKTWVNGRLVSNLIHHEKFQTHGKGFIGLQVHGIGRGEGPYEVAWRNLKIRDFDSAGITAAAANPAGWRSLFDGATLAGWTQKNGTGTYRVEDGMIIGKTAEGSPNSFLCTNETFGDFELELRVKLDSELNSGIQIRSQTKDGPEGRVNGPQVECVADGTAGYVLAEAAGGWMQPESERVPHKHFKDGQWNHYRIVAVGPVIQTWINGQLIARVIDHSRLETHPRGFIGLQVHSIPTGTGPYEVRWKDIKVRDLTGTADLYNGRDLSGLVTTGNWLPQPDGSVLIQPRAGEEGWQRYGAYLWTDRAYKDFQLDVEYKYPPGGNSGVYFRVKDRNDPVETGIEAQILDNSKHEGEMTHHDHGGIIRTQGASKNMSRPPGEWNRMVVTCRGSHCIVELNGEKIIDIQLDEGAMKDRPLEGFIGLQDHGQPNNLYFRSFRVRELE